MLGILQITLRNSPIVPDDLRFRALRVLDSRAGLGQRQFASESGIALGRVNGVLTALNDAGIVVEQAGQHAAGRPRPAYAPIPQGQADRARLTPVILAAKRAERAKLTVETAALSSTPSR